jgi:serine/threonine protein kinase
MGNLIGSEVAGYRVLEELGSYAGITTWRAVSDDERTSVAIKFFPEEVSHNQQLFLQLRDAMRAVFRLDHPNILPIVGSGTHNGHPYIITPFMATGSLSDRYISGTLGALDVDRVIVQIASALEHAHNRAVTHGDLKPSNILFGEEGQVRVVDFGQTFVLQKFNQDPDQVYLAPEIRVGSEATAAADQYNFSALALEMLIGVPFEEISHELSVRSGSPRTVLHRWGSTLKPQVFEVLCKGISPDPDQRFASMSELAHTLRVSLGLASPSVSHDEPADEPPRPPRVRRSRRFLVLLGGALAMGICMVVTFPALSAFWEGLRIDLNPNASSVTPTAEVNAPPSMDGPNPEQGETIILTPAEVVQDPTVDTPIENEESKSQPTSTPKTHDESSQPPSAPTATPTIVFTATSPATETPTVEPTSTTEPTPTATIPDTLPPPTSTSEPPPPEPTINPDNCKTNPKHQYYCTPTP